MIIELFGLPGAGKTSAAELIERNSNFKIVKIESNFELIRLNLFFFLKYPLKFFRILFLFLTNAENLGSFYNKFMNLFFHCNAKYEKAKKISNGLIDQGYFQSAIALFKKPASPNQLNEFIELSTLPDFLIIFNLGEDKMAERIKNKRFFSEKYGDKFFKKRIDIIKSNYKTILENINHYNLKYIIIDANQEKNLVFEEIKNYLNF